MADSRVRDLERKLRAIELRVDALNTRGYPQKKSTQDALDAIKAICREALVGLQVTPAPMPTAGVTQSSRRSNGDER